MAKNIITLCKKSFNATERPTCTGFFSSAFFQRACIFLPPTPFPTTGIEMSPSHAVLSRPWLTATSTSSLTPLDHLRGEIPRSHPPHQDPCEQQICNLFCALCFIGASGASSMPENTVDSSSRCCISSHSTSPYLDTDLVGGA